MKVLCFFAKKYHISSTKFQSFNPPQARVASEILQSNFLRAALGLASKKFEARDLAFGGVDLRHNNL